MIGKCKHQYMVNLAKHTASDALLDVGRFEERSSGAGPEVRKIGALQALVGGNAVGDGLIGRLL